MTVVWNMLITGTGNNITTFLTSVYSNVSQGNFAEYTEGITAQLGITDTSKNKSGIDAFVSTHTGGANTVVGPHYAPADYQNYNPATSPNIMLNPGSNLSQKLYSYGELFKKFAKLFIIFGIAWLIFSRYGSNIIDNDFKLFMVVNILVLGLSSVIPLFSVDYSVLRVYQQALIGLSLPAVTGAYVLLKIIFRRFAFLFTSIFFIVFFLLLSSFLPQLMGFGYAQLGLDNYGFYYDLLYSHRSEQESIWWLSKNANPDIPVFATFSSMRKLAIFGDRPFQVVPNVLPQNITRDAYVYADYSNVNNGSVLTTFGNDALGYSFPKDFLNRHKDLIYSNGQTEIYK